MTPTLPQLIAELKAVEAKATKGPWSIPWMYGAIRHIVRNVDWDMFCAKEDIDKAEAEGFFGLDRNDGPFIALSRNILPHLIEAFEKANLCVDCLSSVIADHPEKCACGSCAVHDAAVASIQSLLAAWRA